MTKRNLETEADTENRGEHGKSVVLYPHRLLVRMTMEERKTLGRKAYGADMSLSRFLVSAASQGKPPASKEERATLESLMFLVKSTANILVRLLANARAMHLVGVNKDIEARLISAHDLLLRLLAELRKRL